MPHILSLKFTHLHQFQIQREERNERKSVLKNQNMGGIPYESAAESCGAPPSPFPQEAAVPYDSASDFDSQWGEWSFPQEPPTLLNKKDDGDGRKTKKKLKKKKSQVLLEGYVEAADEDDLVRTKSLTDEDLDELKGCLDLGFGFSYDEIPELCNTLPALELCYSMSQRFLDDQQKSPERSAPPSSAADVPAASPSAAAASPIACWRISGPGDHPEDVKARLKYWAQAVACTVRLCS